MFAVRTIIEPYVGIIITIISFIIRCWVTWYSRWKFERLHGKFDPNLLQDEEYI